MIYFEVYEQEDLKFFKKIYEESFHESMRKPYRVLKDLIEKDLGKLLIIKKNNIRCGILFLIENDDSVLVDYFAIEEGLRNHNIGSDALALLKKHYKDKVIFFEVERVDETSEEKKEQERRIDFYLRNGCKKSKVFVEAYGSDFELLVMNGLIDYDDYYSFMKDTHDKEYFEKLAIKSLAKLS